MSILYLLIPLAVGLMVVAIAFFLWTVRTGQYDDLEGPAHRILMDDDDPMIPQNARPNSPAQQPGKDKAGEQPAAGKEDRGANDNAID
jgi:cbb3-type cytochrome oxidase maturation protein